MKKILLASVASLGMVALPALVSAQTVAEPVTPAPVPTQLAGFDSFSNAPMMGSLNAGFAIGIATATVLILATRSDSTPGTR